MKEVLFRGPEFDDGFILLPGTSEVVYLTPVIPIAEGDDVTVTGVVPFYASGHPISVQHGEDEIGTVENTGPFTRSFTATNDTNLCRLVSDGAHHLSYLEVSREV